MPVHPALARTTAHSRGGGAASARLPGRARPLQPAYRLRPRSGVAVRPEADVKAVAAQYLAGVLSDDARRIVPIFAVAVAIVAALINSSTVGEVVLMAIPPPAFAAWAYAPRLPLAVVAVAVVVPVVAVQHSGTHEPIMFEASLLAFVVACWSDSLVTRAKGYGERSIRSTTSDTRSCGAQRTTSSRMRRPAVGGAERSPSTGKA